ncbi:MAG: class I SAM-dependent methyltransferase [Planctomycetota bacterium]
MKAGLLRLLDRAGLLDQALRVRDRRRYRRDREKVERDARFVADGAPDGLPVPVGDLVYLVSRQFSPEAFYRSGVEGADAIRATLRRSGVELDGLGAILDFGCGCGRVLRQWGVLDRVDVHGTDYNERLAGWCHQNLPFATIATNRLQPPTDYADGTFDLVYAISVFTHLNEDLQHAWMAELTRILAPGGHLLFSVHGPTRTGMFDDEERARWDRGELVLRHQGYEGGNLCSAFHPERYLREVLCRDLHFVDYVPLGASDAQQDYVLVRRRDG